MSDFIAKGNVLNFFQKCVTKNVKIAVTEAAFTCSKLTIETLMNCRLRRLSNYLFDIK